jgi:hypothetical protein
MSLPLPHPLDKQLRLWTISADYATANPEHRAKNPHLPGRAAAVLASVRASGASLTPDQMAMVGSLSAFAGMPVAIPAPARVPAAAVPVMATPTRARVALSADDAAAILAEGKRLRLDAMAARMVVLGVSKADATDLLATAASGAGGVRAAGAVLPAVSGAGAVVPVVQHAGPGGAGVNLAAVAAARAYAASRRSRVA